MRSAAVPGSSVIMFAKVVLGDVCSHLAAGNDDGVSPRAGAARPPIGAGIDPNAMVDTINEAQEQRAAAMAELEGAPAPTAVTDAEVYAMIDAPPTGVG